MFLSLVWLLAVENDRVAPFFDFGWLTFETRD
jgi:hypothetical protein